ncbi:MAG: hypothetical protein M1825_004626 [Sarcosagium campestre]|nr:MAG: hypothetical protein M1825_004626 [Sarcosagium campestre]
MDSIKALVLKFQAVINYFLPFTRPGTPIFQDIVHTLILCTILWFAPQWLEQRAAERYFERSEQRDDADRAPDVDDAEIVPEPPPEDNEGELDGPQLPAPEIEDVIDEDFLRFQRADEDIPPEFLDDNFAGPAHPPAQQPQHTAAARARDVGKKKAKSLARKDQRRAYHEFMRSQGEAQRARDRTIAEEREAQVREERKRRAELERVLEDKRREERSQRKLEETQRREEEISRRKLAVELVRTNVEKFGWADLKQVAEDVGGDVDEAWVERLCKADGFINSEPKEGEMIVATKTGFVVKVGDYDLRQTRLRISAAVQGKSSESRVSLAQVASVLEQVIRGEGKFLHDDATLLQIDDRLNTISASSVLDAITGS